VVQDKAARIATGRVMRQMCQTKRFIRKPYNQ